MGKIKNIEDVSSTLRVLNYIGDVCFQRTKGLTKKYNKQLKNKLIGDSSILGDSHYKIEDHTVNLTALKQRVNDNISLLSWCIYVEVGSGYIIPFSDSTNQTQKGLYLKSNLLVIKT